MNCRRLIRPGPCSSLRWSSNWSGGNSPEKPGKGRRCHVWRAWRLWQTLRRMAEELAAGASRNLEGVGVLRPGPCTAGHMVAA